MTHDERAALAVVEWHARHYWAYDPTQHAELQADIARAIAGAVAAERERCAAVVAGFAYRGDFGTNPPDRFIESIIKAIREGR